MENLKKFYKNKRILITGHTGFKGSWLSNILAYFGANIYGIALKPQKKIDNYYNFDLKKKLKDSFLDIRNYSKLKKKIQKFKPEIIFHLAAQSLVKDSYKFPHNTFSTNYLGLLNILEVSRSLKSLKSIIIVTSDKCYKNKENKKGYHEDDEIGGIDPYSASKAACENLFYSYNHSFFFNKTKIGIASVRAGNVIGGGDWSKDRIIPDFIKSIKLNKKFIIRSPNAIRPWQHVLDLLHGYLVLAKKLYINPKKFNGSWNFGPSSQDSTTVIKLIERLKKKGNFDKKIFIRKDNKIKETLILKLISTKSKKYLNWKPKLSVKKSIDLTAEWYDIFLKRKNISEFTIKQIRKFFYDKWD